MNKLILLVLSLACMVALSSAYYYGYAPYGAMGMGGMGMRGGGIGGGGIFGFIICIFFLIFMLRILGNGFDSDSGSNGHGGHHY